jgi:hypothetical protein
MDSRLIRFRINRDIEEKAHRMAAERGMELPDVVRMMLTKAVRIGDFALDQDRDAVPKPAVERPFQAYEPRYWDPLKASLDAEAALALLNQAIADRTAWLDEGPSARSPEQCERVREERDEACRLLGAFDPTDQDAVALALARFGPWTPPSSTGEATE